MKSLRSSLYLLLALLFVLSSCGEGGDTSISRFTLSGTISETSQYKGETVVLAIEGEQESSDFFNLGNITLSSDGPTSFSVSIDLNDFANEYDEYYLYIFDDADGSGAWESGEAYAYLMGTADDPVWPAYFVGFMFVTDAYLIEEGVSKSGVYVFRYGDSDGISDADLFTGNLSGLQFEEETWYGLPVP